MEVLIRIAGNETYGENRSKNSGFNLSGALPGMVTGANCRGNDRYSSSHHCNVLGLLVGE